MSALMQALSDGAQIGLVIVGFVLMLAIGVFLVWGGIVLILALQDFRKARAKRRLYRPASRRGGSGTRGVG